MRTSVALMCIAVAAFMGFANSSDLTVGQRYEIVGELYAFGVATNLDTRQLSSISLVPLRLSGPEILWQRAIPKGSTLAIVGKAAARWPGFLHPDRYFVRLTGVDVPVGIPVMIDLMRGIEGTSTALNPSIFKPLP
jgi:hypothetical protein